MDMRASLEGIELPTRIKNNLVNMVEFGGPQDWPSLVDFYKTDPAQTRNLYLRTPGGGTASWVVLQEELRRGIGAASVTDSVIWLRAGERQALHNVLIKVASGSVPDLADRDLLSRLAKYLEAHTIRIRW